MGSEMCIRDSGRSLWKMEPSQLWGLPGPLCLLTSGKDGLAMRRDTACSPTRCSLWASEPRAEGLIARKLPRDVWYRRQKGCHIIGICIQVFWTKTSPSLNVLKFPPVFSLYTCFSFYLFFNFLFWNNYGLMTKEHREGPRTLPQLPPVWTWKQPSHVSGQEVDMAFTLFLKNMEMCFFHGNIINHPVGVPLFI